MFPQEPKNTILANLSSLFRLSRLPACCAAISLTSSSLSAAVEQAKSADSFVESVGVVTHLPFTGGAYGDFTGLVKPKLMELGVRYIRDGIVVRGSQGGRDAMATKLLDLQSTAGIKAIICFSGDSMTTVSNFLNTCSSALIGVEGANEPDLAKYNFIYNGNGWQGGVAVGAGWVTGAKNYQTDLFNLINNTPAFSALQVQQMSMGWGGASSSVGNHEAFADLGNFHWYVQTAYPPELPSQFDWLINNARLISPTKQLMPTESGYPAVTLASEPVHARYTMRTICEGFRKNFKRTYLYELVDENPTDKFGLLRNDGTARPAFGGIKNLLALLRDPGATFSPATLDYSVTDSSTTYPADSAGLRRFLVQKADGRFYLVLWHAAKSGYGNGSPATVADRSVTIAFGSQVGLVKTYLPLNGASPVDTYSNPSSIVVSVPDHPLVLEISNQPTEVIVDNTDTGSITLTGAWTASSGVAGFYGTDYLHDGNTGKGTKSVKFTPSLTGPGSYNVYIRYTSATPRAANAPVSIVHQGGTASIALDQRTGGGTWKLLGTYSFSAGTAGSVTLGTTGTVGYVIADAVKFEPVAELPPEVIVDNTTPGAVTLTGAWTASTGLAGYYGTNYLHDGNTGKGSKSAKFTPDILGAGTYNVYIRFTSDSTRASNAPIDIVYQGGTDAVSLDQRTGGGTWVLLGTYPFALGTAGSVTLRNAGTTGYVIADAVKFEPQ